MSTPVLILFLLVGAAVVGGLIVLVMWWVAPAEPTREDLRPGPVVRLGRWYRSLWGRGWANAVVWPHLGDVLLGTPRTPTGTTPSDEVWAEGTARVVRYRSERRGGEPVLLVHALVTRPWILDLTPERSLVAFLLSEGFDVFLLDWGEPTRADRDRGLLEYAMTLMRAEQEVMAVADSSRIHLIGYCMAGTLCLVRAAAWPDPHLGSLAVIAAPVDAAVSGGMATMMSSRLLKPTLALDGSGMVPRSYVRESFHVLRPRAIKTVYRRLFRRRGEEDYRTFYGALARWVWEHGKLPGALFFDLVDMFRSNGLYEGTLRLGDRVASPRRIEAPILSVIASRDHIVPPGSSLGLSSITGMKADTEVVRAPGGHVSMLAGSGAREVLWPALGAWLRARAGPAR